MYHKLRNALKIIMIKVKFRKSHSYIGKIVSVNNPQYISVGKNVRIKDYCRIDSYKTFGGGGGYNPSLIIGNGVNIQYFFTSLIADKCVIGENSIIAHNVSLITENHGDDIESDIPIHAQKLRTGPVSIGCNCWVGCNTVFLPDSAVGDNCIVAANSVVNRKFPAHCMIGGCPARILKIYDFEKHKWIKFYDDKIIKDKTMER